VDQRTDQPDDDLPPADVVAQLGWSARRQLGREITARQRERTRTIADDERRKRRDNAETDKRKRADDKRKRRQDARNAAEAGTDGGSLIARHRALAITVLTIALSLSTAIPSQIKWLNAAPRNLGLAAWTLGLLVELLGWLGAFLYLDAVKRGKSEQGRVYRLTTWFFAAVAALMNFAHGFETSWIVGVGLAIASLMGVGAFELYMHKKRNLKIGLSPAEMRVIWLRQVRFRKVVREQNRLRAVYGAGPTDEVLWRMAWLRKEGTPTVPVPLASPVITAFFASATSDANTANTKSGQSSDVAPVDLHAEPSSSTAVDGGSLAVAEREQGDHDGEQVIELAIDWSQVNDLGSLVERYWPEVTGAPGEPPANSDQAHANGDPEQTDILPVIGANDANTDANTDGEQTPDPYAAIPADQDETVAAATRLRRYFARVHELGVPADHIAPRRGELACGTSLRYAQIAYRTWYHELTANSPAKTGHEQVES
jgi:hypothetical protein